VHVQYPDWDFVKEGGNFFLKSGKQPIEAFLGPKIEERSIKKEVNALLA